MERILCALEKLRLTPTVSEYILHRQVCLCLEEAGLLCVHEQRVGKARRIDFVCEGIGIEIKRGKPVPGRLLAQLEAYASSAEIQGIILLVER